MAFEHFDKCQILLPMNGANNGITFSDYSVVPKTVTAVGNAKTSTAQSKYYGSSGYFDGSGDYLTLSNTRDLHLTNQDFTLSAWVYPEALAGENGIIGKWSGADNYSWIMVLNASNQIAIYYYTNATTSVFSNFTSSFSVTDGVWTHIAITRSGNTLRIFANGVLRYTNASFTPTIFNPAAPITCGGDGVGGSSFKGYLQDVYMLLGVAQWTADFTPPDKTTGIISGVVKDKNNAVASRIITAIPRNNPTRVFQTTSSGADGTYSLRVPATEVSRIALANETELYNDIVDRIYPE